MSRQRAHADRFRRVMTGVNNYEIMLFCVDRSPVRPFADDQSIDACSGCFTEHFCGSSCPGANPPSFCSTPRRDSRCANLAIIVGENPGALDQRSSVDIAVATYTDEDGLESSE